MVNAKRTLVGVHWTAQGSPYMKGKLQMIIFLQTLGGGKTAVFRGGVGRAGASEAILKWGGVVNR